MGAWGMGVFENDAALDFMDVDLIKESDPRKLLRKTFETAISADYLINSDACNVLVAAAIVDAVLKNKPICEDEDEDWTEWREKIKLLDFSELKPLALKACQKVIADPDKSELMELWMPADEEDFKMWKKTVDNLIANLSS